NLQHISSADFATTLPSALLQALMTDSKTKVLQAPQLRAIDNVKATAKIGDKVPIATGSFGSSLGGVGVGVSPLVQTQFQFLDVGVNVEMLPRVHDNGDVSMHLDLEISAVTGTADLGGGLKQPIVEQRRIGIDARLHEGEVSLIGGLTKTQNSKQIS